jgi:hypothetical protein
MPTDLAVPIKDSPQTTVSAPGTLDDKRDSGVNKPDEEKGISSSLPGSLEQEDEELKAPASSTAAGQASKKDSDKLDPTDQSPE